MLPVKTSMTLLTLLSVITWQLSEATADLMINFDDLSGYTTTGTDGSYFDGHGAAASTGSWSTNGVSFNTGQFGPGWSYSNVNDTTTAGFTNQWAAYSGTDVSGSGNYVTGNFSQFAFDQTGVLPYFNLPTNYTVDSVMVTNTTYAALSMRDGDAFATPFANGDFFRVIFTGYSGLNATGAETGTQDFFLGDYRASQTLIVDDWNLVDLTGLGGAQSVSIGFEGSKVGMSGLNTPAYVAIDNLSLNSTSVPEPGSTLVFVAVGGSWCLYRRRRNRG